MELLLIASDPHDLGPVSAEADRKSTADATTDSRDDRDLGCPIHTDYSLIS